ncbi:MAG: hypothetical protein M3N07_08780 [Pseudomonadota bacterium]|nr:hypothetical protein [Pseudomonadota bacterium]
MRNGIMRSGAKRALLVGGAAALGATGALAHEIVEYSYDARGRLVKVVRSGTVNNGVTTAYEHDKADNRTRRETKTGQ